MSIRLRAPMYQAIASGVSVSGATLTFNGEIYADPECITPLANPLTSDAAGRFVAIYIPQGATYTATLKRPTGQTLNSFASLTGPFFAPAVGLTARDEKGDVIPFATLDLYWSQITVPRVAYSDEALENSIGSTLTADASGVFPDAWLPDSRYRYVLKDAQRELIYDVSALESASVPVPPWGGPFNIMHTFDGEEYTYEYYTGALSSMLYSSELEGNYYLQISASRPWSVSDDGIGFPAMTTNNYGLDFTQHSDVYAFSDGMYIGRALPNSTSTQAPRKISYSNDGATFAQDFTGELFYKTGLAYGNGVYVLCGRGDLVGTFRGGSMLAYGRDILSLSQIRPSVEEWDAGLQDTKFIEGKFYAVGVKAKVGTDPDKALIKTSDDGIEWATQVNDFTMYPQSIAYGNGVYVIAGGYPLNFSSGLLKTLVSADGENWTLHTGDASSRPIGTLVFGNGRFVGISDIYFYSGSGSSPYIQHSTDGETWTRYTMPGGAVNGLAFGNGVFVCVDSSVAKFSSDGLSWTNSAVQPGGSFTSALFDGTQFLIFTTTGAHISPDGSTWTIVSGSPAGYRSRFSFFANEHYAALGGSAAQNDTSENLTDWGQFRLGPAGRHVAAGNGRFVRLRALAKHPYVTTDIIGEDYVAEWSEDGFNWTPSTTVIDTIPVDSTTPPYLDFHDGLFIAGGKSGSDDLRTYTSADGDVWAIGEEYPSAEVSVMDVAKVGPRWLSVTARASGPQGLYRSTDGLEWTPVTGLSINRIAAVQEFQGLFYACGTDIVDDVRCAVIALSFNGMSWIETYRQEFETLGFNPAGMANMGDESMIVTGRWAVAPT